MFINFDQVAVWKSVGIDYFSNSNSDLKNLNDTEWAELFNQWLSFEGSNGADVRCTVVHLGKRLSGNFRSLRIAVYEVGNPFESLVLLPLNKVSDAIEIMKSMAGCGELVCCE